MKAEKSYFEKGNETAKFSLLYPKRPGAVSNQQNLFLELSPAAAHDLGQSYAREIAAAYGISYQQLENVFSEGGVL